MKLEAVERMKILNLMPSVINDFNKKDIVFYSEFYGILYWLSNKPEWAEIVKNFETKHNVLVYHIELSHLEFGDCLSLFYVNGHKDGWAWEKKNMRAGYCYCYVKNLDDDFCSKFGSIGFKPLNGGVKRVA